MAKNVHHWDRAIRVVVGLVMVSMAFFGPENLWFLVGLVPLITGLAGVCPIYNVAGVNTCKVSGKGSAK